MSRVVALPLLAVMLAGCAWTRRENRPVWNAFESHLVPADTGWFVAALPLTVPGGLAAIVADTLVAHPIQVVDDAWDDAASLWRDGRPDFAEHYWSEMAFLPVRVALTPTCFVFSFLGRSMFDFGPESEAPPESRPARPIDDGREPMLAWLSDVAAGGSTAYAGRTPDTLDPDLRNALARALRDGHALGRREVYRVLLRWRLPAAVADLTAGLRDPDPVVRFSLIEWWPHDRAVSPELVQELYGDAVDAVRRAARARWPSPAQSRGQ